MTFEEKMRQLEQLATQLEQGVLSLSEAMALYEKGMALSQQCKEDLQNAETQFSLHTAEQEAVQK